MGPRGLDRDGLRRLWVGGGDRAGRSDSTRLSSVPVPGLRQTVQRAQRRCPQSSTSLRATSLPSWCSGACATSRACGIWRKSFLTRAGSSSPTRRCGIGRRGSHRLGGEPPSQAQRPDRPQLYIDETYIRVRGERRYLYRAIDRDGALVDASRWSKHRDLAAAKAFFRSAKTVTGVTPDRVTTDGHDAYPRAIRTELGRQVRHRTSCYLNNRLEQDHRGIKGRCRPMLGLKSPRRRHAICRCHDELRNFLRCRSRMRQHVPAATQRWQHMRKAAIALHILATA